MVAESKTLTVSSPCGTIHVVLSRTDEGDHHLSAFTKKTGTCIQSTLDVDTALSNLALDHGSPLDAVVDCLLGNSCSRAQHDHKSGTTPSCHAALGAAVQRLMEAGHEDQPGCLSTEPREVEDHAAGTQAVA